MNKETKSIEKLVDTIQDETQEALSEIQKTGTHPNAAVLSDLKKRKLLERGKIISYSVQKGPMFSLIIQKLETELTADMVAS